MSTLSIFLPVIKKSFLFLAALVFAAYASSLALSADAPEVTAEMALEQLLRGNERFTLGKLAARDYPHERRDLVNGQHPYAIVLACSDSRVPPEIIFDESLGKLFIIRVAGHVADPAVLGSIEYAVEHLHTRLLFVLGHEGCGAVKATLAGGLTPPNISSLLARIIPAAEKARGGAKMDEPALLSVAVKENVRYQMQMALYESDVLTHEVQEKKLNIVGGVYNLDSGRVEMLSPGLVVEMPANAKPHAADAPHGEAHKPRQEHDVAPAAHHVAVHTAAPSIPHLAELVQSAYEKKFQVVMQKSSPLHDSDNQCAFFDCQNIPAGARITVDNPLILQVGGKPQIKVKYKGHSGYVFAHEKDFAFIALMK